VDAIARHPCQVRATSKDDRAECLEHLCSDDPSLYRDALELVAADEAAAGWLEISLPAHASGDRQLPRHSRRLPLSGPASVAAAWGRVYRAIQQSLGREVALKVIRADQLYFAQIRSRFAREAKLIAKLQHPGSFQYMR